MSQGIEFDHIAMMKDPWSWPHLILPLKRSVPGSFPQLGVFLGEGPTVVLRSMYDLRPGDEITEQDKITYESFEACYEDGWRVD